MLMKRLLTVAIALPLFAAALLLLPQNLWALFLLPGIVIGSWEWGGLAGYAMPGRVGFALLVPVSAVALLYIPSQSMHSSSLIDLFVYGASVVFWLAIAPVWLAKCWTNRNPIVLGIAGWLALVPMWLALVRLQATPWLLLLILSIVWIADTAAYIAGKLWGRNKLAPRISPGKTWEGVLGATAAVGLYYGALLLIFPADERYFSGWLGLAVFAGIIALSIEGDLFESWTKRQAGVKDSGQILPGHGGILDRIDGLTASVPAAALAFYLH